MKVSELRDALARLPQDSEVLIEVLTDDGYAYPEVNVFALDDQGDVILLHEEAPLDPSLIAPEEV